MLTSVIGCAGSDDGFAQDPECDDGKCDSPLAGGTIPGVAPLRMFSKVTFDVPVQMLMAPGDASRWFIVEHTGKVQIIANDANASATTTFVDLTDKVNFFYERGLNG